MSAKRGAIEVVLAEGLIQTAVQVAMISVLIWGALIGLRHPEPFWPVAALTAAFIVLVRVVTPWGRR